MRVWIIMIAVGRMGTIWIRDRVTNKIFQSIVVLSFTGYVLGKHNAHEKKYPKFKKTINKHQFSKRIL